MKPASIEEVAEILPHPNADRLEVARVLGWQCVVQKGAFQPGDKVVYVAVDTILPDAEWSSFLKKGDKPIRLRTIKLRGLHSQGLVLPLSVLDAATAGWHVGADVSGALGVKKYEKEIPAVLSGEAKSKFPEHLVSRTDEDNGLSNPSLVDYVLSLGDTIATMKYDGSSCTVIITQGKIASVCSRNLELAEDDRNSFWKAARRLKVGSLPPDCIIQGELMGPGIQGNQLGLTEPKLFVYQIKVDGQWMSYNEMAFWCENSDTAFAPRLEWNLAGKNLSQLQEMVDDLTLDGERHAEGAVFRPAQYPASGNGRPLGFKLINRNYNDSE